MSDDQLQQLADALEGLYDVYRPEGVGIWLKGAKGQFGGLTPIEMIRRGDVWELAHAVERMRAGTPT